MPQQAVWGRPQRGQTSCTTHGYEQQLQLWWWGCRSHATLVFWTMLGSHGGKGSKQQHRASCLEGSGEECRPDRQGATGPHAASSAYDLHHSRSLGGCFRAHRSALPCYTSKLEECTMGLSLSCALSPSCQTVAETLHTWPKAPRCWEVTGTEVEQTNLLRAAVWEQLHGVIEGSCLLSAAPSHPDSVHPCIHV